jgi:thioredoxin 1
MKRAIVLALVIAAIGGVVFLKKGSGDATPLPTHTPGIPRLLDLGSKGCTACTMLEPVLEELRQKHAGQLQVDFIDVCVHDEVTAEYGIEIIPVQIFFDADGQELYRHQGFISAEEIEGKFRELGVPLDAG